MSVKTRLTKSFYDITFEKLMLGIEKQSMSDALNASAPRQELESSFKKLFRGTFYNGKTENAYVKKCRKICNILEFSIL